MSILIKTVRIAGFRGLENLEVTLEQTTVLTGMNNTGKTSFLKALQLALGSRQFISPDDFFIRGNNHCQQITLDLLIVPVNDDGSPCDDFSEDWEVLLTTDRIRTNGTKSFVPLRTIGTLDPLNSSYNIQQFILTDWPAFHHDNKDWHQQENGNKKPFFFDELPFFYMDAQRDILEDTKQRHSYLGKMLANIEYSPTDIEDIENQIKQLNEKAVSSSAVLCNIKETLKELDTAMDSHSGSIEITPFTKKIRDLNKGLSIYYSDNQDSFAMEYHGMGTRSWSSLLTLKSFIRQLASHAERKQTVFFPLLAIEEPEAHLHPNAQKKLYGQINAITGQKIISTHSPYIAATAELKQIRNFYKNARVCCGRIETENLNAEEIRKINRQVVNSRGEIFFSKLIVFFEGETEEQALPIFAQQYFGKTPVEMGIDFVGVGGYRNYLSFLRFAEALNIPWLILSDADQNVPDSVRKQRVASKNTKAEGDVIVFLDAGNDFERQLIVDGFQDEIKLALEHLHDHEYLEQYIKKQDGSIKKRIKTEKICKSCHQNIYDDLLINYNNDDGFQRALYDCMTGQKTQFGPAIAEQIIASGKDLPPKVIALFDKIKAILKLNEVIT